MIINVKKLFYACKVFTIQIVLNLILKSHLLILFLFLNGCISPERHPGDFVEPTDFHLIQSFRIGEITTSGMPWEASMSKSLKGYTKEILRSNLERKGFQENLKSANCLVRARWHKRLRVQEKTVKLFDDSWRTSSSVEIYKRPLVWVGLTVEFYNPRTDQIFWRVSLDDCAKAINLNEATIIRIIENAVLNFPECVKFNPELKSFK
jgi:hypothetical protein